MIARTFASVLMVWLGTAAAQPPPRFQSAAVCATCHSRIPHPESKEGEPVSPFVLWSGSMMSNSARDPYWRAKVAQEVAANPGRAGEIEDHCLRCHAPAGQYPVRASQGRFRLSEVGGVSAEGVTCTICHQIRAEEGTASERFFNAGFEIVTRGAIFGPHEAPFAMPMLHHTAYEPVYDRRTLSPELCATCHTVLSTHEASGSGRFVEQGPYLEWALSDYKRRGVTCQQCHMPQLLGNDGRPTTQYIAHRPPGGPFPPTEPRSPFGLHLLIGGNAQVSSLLARGNAEMKETPERARSMLRRSIDVQVRQSFDGQRLALDVRVENLAGHKVPTGFPSRALWLHVRVVDGGERVLFESGAPEKLAAFEPHRDVITRPDEAAVFETEAAGKDGKATALLTRAVRPLKDNRLLPAGFDLSRALPEGIGARALAPAGVERDADFGPGGDTVHYRVHVPGAARAEVIVYYTSIKSFYLPSAESFRAAMKESLAPVAVLTRSVRLSRPAQRSSR